MFDSLPAETVLCIDCVDKATARLAALRLECLKLASDAVEVRLSPDTPHSQAVIAAAREMFDYVTDAPERPEPYVVQRMGAADPVEHESLGPLNHLAFDGHGLVWRQACFAYRFRSKREAETAIAKYQDLLGGVMLPMPLPSYMDLF